MAAKAQFDVTNRLIILTEPPVDGVASIDLRVDLYSDGKEDWELNANDERAHRFPFITSQTAGSPTSGGRDEPIFFRLRNGPEGWRIQPFDSDHTLTIIGTLVPQDETLPVFEPRPGRTILAITDGSEVAQLTQGNTLSPAQDQRLSDIHGQVQRAIYVDTEQLTNGNGYQQSPFNNWTDAVDEAEATGLLTLNVLADAVVDRQLKNFVINGVGNPTIDLNNQIFDGTLFERCTLTGTLQGAVNATECSIFNITNIAGVYLTVAAAGTLEVSPGANLLISRIAPLVAAQPWTLSMNSGQASTAAVHNISGGVIVTNMDDAGDVLHLHFSQGELTIDSSCTAGTLLVTGDVEVIDNGAGVSVDVSAANQPAYTREVWQMHGLEEGNPMTVTPTSRQTQGGEIDQVITGDGENISTVTRQP